MRFAVLLASTIAGAISLPAAAQQPAASGPEAEQAVLMRSVLEALRQNTAALQKNSQTLETFSNRLERVEAATRNVPPAMEGLRTDIIAIRAGLDRLVSATSGRRPAATLRFSPFACGNEAEASCAVNACKSVGYGNGLAVAVNRTGTGATVRPTSIAEATCWE
ncbi:MAG: hypothetical protein JWQ36_2406 [Enterovirga sp.]|jgi:hypothetical protein|nr:hypothetical protein [Enterovirga sp.]